jgi:myo-inositol-1(or 4)-monophosphatase
MVSAETLAAYLETARQAAREGAAVLARWRHRFTAREKGRFDLVTEADLESQRTIRAFVLDRHPGHAFLGEEDGPGPAHLDPGAPPTWIVDPLDGTTNYVHACPFYCVSIGLQVAGELVVGVVYDPSLEEMFHGAKGMGDWLGSDRLRPSQTRTLAEALLATGFPPDLIGQEKTLEWWRYFSLRTQSLRRTGSTALNLAYVAAGRFDGFWGFNNHAWDVAGAAVLIQEAGGTITQIDGSGFDPHRPDALASNGPLHPVLLEALGGDPNQPVRA